MRVVLDCASRHFSPVGVAHVFREYLLAAARHNALCFLTGQYPELYKCNPPIRFVPEPWQGQGWEEIASIPLVHARGYGDCDDLVAWRVGELLAQGVAAGIKVYWRCHPELSVGGHPPVRLFHAEVRLPDGSVEDPSRYLGM